MYIANAQQMREIDRRAIEEWGIPGMVLMENAAKAVVSELTRIIRDPAPILILAGKGNNGGDGLAIARHLQIIGYAPVVYLFADPQDLAGDALHNYSLYAKMNGKLREVKPDTRCNKTFEEFCCDLWRSAAVVDALYGTGFSGDLPPWIRRFTESVNSVHTTPLTIVAVDIPSGLDAQRGRAAEGAVRAHVTVTFGLPKIGHVLEQGPSHTGRLVVDRISLPDHVIDAQNIHTHLLTVDRVREFLPQRPRGGHKGTHGCGLIVGGSTGMSGAVILAGCGALRSGIGLVQIVSPPGIASLVDAGLVEATVWPAGSFIATDTDLLKAAVFDKSRVGMNTGETLNTGDTLDSQAWSVIAERLPHAQACAVGPGLKQPPEFMEVLHRLLRETHIPLILDADALNLLSSNMDMLEERRALGPEKRPLILTPHPGEMSRLCQVSIAEVQSNRLELATRKAQEWNAVVVLKGANTVIASPLGTLAINTTGNSGLGTGGTGDVLTGSLLAWLAQGVPSFHAACLAVYLHGRSADHLAMTHGAYGFTAGEVAEGLCKAQQELIFLNEYNGRPA